VPPARWRHLGRKENADRRLLSAKSSICRQIGISEATYYVWQKKYAELGVAKLRRLKMLEDENARLKRIVADLTLERRILQEVGRKKL
jgi:putative transposase